MSGIMKGLLTVLAGATVLVLFTPQSAQGQDCSWYCRATDDGESGWYKCDSSQVTHAPCTATWPWGIGCSSGCNQITLAPTWAPDGSAPEDSGLAVVLAQHPEWGHALYGEEGRNVVRTSCNGAITARLYDDGLVARLRDESRVIVL